MDYKTFQEKVHGKKVDFYHNFAPSSIDLVAQYLYEVHSLAVRQPANTRELWDNPPTEMAQSFFKIQENGTNPGDIVVFADGCGVATGSTTDLTVETLIQEQTVALKDIDKAMVIGLIRHSHSQPLPPVEPPETEPEQSVMESLPKVYKPPQGALPVPRNRVEFKIVTEIKAYGYMSHAQTGEKPVETLKPGKYFMLSQHGGMAKIDRGEGTSSYWINPADNIVKQFNDAFRPDTRHDYRWYHEPIKFKADGEYVKRNKRAEVFSFKTGKDNAQIGYQQPVWLAGEFTDGERRYGVPANPLPDGTYRRMLDFGVPMNYLSLAQMDYDPDEDDLIQDVEPAAAESMIPVRQVTVKDNITLVKAHGQKFLDGFIRKAR